MIIDKLRFSVYHELVKYTETLALDTLEGAPEIEQALGRIEEHIRRAVCQVVIVSNSGHFADLLMNRFTGTVLDSFTKLHNIQLLQTTLGCVQDISENADEPGIYIFEATTEEIHNAYLDYLIQTRENCPNADAILLLDTDKPDVLPISEEQLDLLKENRISVWTYSAALAIRGQQLYPSKMLESSGFRKTKLLLIDTIEIARRRQLIHYFMEYDSVIHGIYDQFMQKVTDGKKKSDYSREVIAGIQSIPAAFDDSMKNRCISMCDQIGLKCLPETSLSGLAALNAELPNKFTELQNTIQMIIASDIQKSINRGLAEEVCGQEAIFKQKLCQALVPLYPDFPALRTVYEFRQEAVLVKAATFSMPTFLLNPFIPGWEFAEMNRREEMTIDAVAHCLQAYKLRVLVQLKEWLTGQEKWFAQKAKELQNAIAADISREIEENEKAVQQIIKSAAFHHVCELIQSATALKEKAEIAQ